MSDMILTSQVHAMSLSQDQSHPIPSPLFGFPSYLVIPKYPPDCSSGLTIAAISSPLA